MISAQRAVPWSNRVRATAASPASVSNEPTAGEAGSGYCSLLLLVT